MDEGEYGTQVTTVRGDRKKTFLNMVPIEGGKVMATTNLEGATVGRMSLIKQHRTDMVTYLQATLYLRQ